MDRFAGDVIDTDKSMIAACRNKRQLRAIRRPLRVSTMPAHHNLLRFFRCVQARKPELVILYPCDHALRGNRRPFSPAKLLGFASGPSNGPDGLFNSRGVAGGIRRLAGRIFAFASRINQSIAIRRKIKIRQLLAVVSIIFS